MFQGVCVQRKSYFCSSRGERSMEDTAQRTSPRNKEGMERSGMCAKAMGRGFKAKEAGAGDSRCRRSGTAAREEGAQEWEAARQRPAKRLRAASEGRPRKRKRVQVRSEAHREEGVEVAGLGTRGTMVSLGSRLSHALNRVLTSWTQYLMLVN